MIILKKDTFLTILFLIRSSYLLSLSPAPHLRTEELRGTAAEHSASEKSCSGVMLLSRVECTWGAPTFRRTFFIPGTNSGLPRPLPLPLPMLASLSSWQIDSVTISGMGRLLLTVKERSCWFCCWLLFSCTLPRPKRRVFSWPPTLLAMQAAVLRHGVRLLEVTGWA